MNKEHIKGIKDKPLSGRNEDKLGITSSAKALTEFIDTCQTPMTIGIQGSWGTGKTSILNMMKEKVSLKFRNYLILKRIPHESFYSRTLNGFFSTKKIRFNSSDHLENLSLFMGDDIIQLDFKVTYISSLTILTFLPRIRLLIS